MSDQPQVPVNVNVTQPQAGVVISLADIYAEVVSTRTEVTAMRSEVANVLKTDADHEARIRALQDSRGDYVTKRGMTTVITILISLCLIVEPVVLALVFGKR